MKYLASSAVLSGKIKTKLIIRQGGLCPVCNTHLLNNELELHTHHIKPRRLGGSDKLQNLLLLHKDCHKQVEYTTVPSQRAAFRSNEIIKDK